MSVPIFLTLFTPTYNRAHTLHRVYESIRSQTLQQLDGAYLFEWIIVDDGSQDGTGALIKQWQNESDFPIRYTYQENRGKPAASRLGIEMARGELFLFADSDDAFVPETFETFHAVWREFSAEERRRCGGIGVLCRDQYGRRVGRDYPVEGRLIPAEEAVFGWRELGLGETWAALKTENLKKAFMIPEEARHLKFIPESFFWSRTLFETPHYSYFLNKVLRVYYRNEEEKEALSLSPRTRYPEAFFFESCWFVRRYGSVLFRYPSLYLRHLLKCIYFFSKVKRAKR